LRSEIAKAQLGFAATTVWAMIEPRPEVCFATPRKLPRAASLKGRVVVLDVAFASEGSGSGFDKVTKPLIVGLGERLRAWVDHHDHLRHADYASDDRFLLRKKSEHGACPELVTEALVQKVGPIETIVCHTDFDGLASAAKWLRGGKEPYPGCDDDARAIDTRIGTPSAIANRLDRAIRACGGDFGILGLIVRHLSTGLADAALWGPIDAVAAKLDEIEKNTREIARGYEVLQLTPPFETSSGKKFTSLAYLNLIEQPSELGLEKARKRYDKTMLLLIGQDKANMAVMLDRDTLTLAAPFDSGANFLELCGLTGGMPTLVSLQAPKWPEIAKKLGCKGFA
jgi:hypothetical protein